MGSLRCELHQGCSSALLWVLAAVVAATAAADERQTRCTVEPSTAATAVQTALDAAVRAGSGAFTVPHSSTPYCFGNSSLIIEGAKGLNVSLGSNAFVFSTPHGILLRDSVGVTLHGDGPDSPAQISYDPP
eukprot:COSAG02_NODE_18461_length_936_cov_26.395460_1_plen_130_part_01